MTQPPERRGGRRRLREPEPEPGPPPARPNPPRDTRTSGRHDLPQPSGRRRRPAEDDYADYPDTGNHADQADYADYPDYAEYEAPRERIARRPEAPGRRRRPEPEPEPIEPDPRTRRLNRQARHGLDEQSEPIEPIERPAPPPARRRAAEPPQAPARTSRRQAQPGDGSVGVPAAGERPPPRRRPRPAPAPPPVREEPPTDVLPALAPPEPEPAPPRRGRPDEPAEDDFFDDHDYSDHDYGDDEYSDYSEYDDYEGEYAEEEEYGDEFYDEPQEKPRRRKRGKRAIGWIAAVAVIAALAGGAWYGFEKIFGYADFDGGGEASQVLVQVDDGDSTSAIGTKLVNAGVVASSKAFVKAGEKNTALTKIQHGYYLMKEHMSGASAVDLIVQPTSRVGQLQIKPYTQFDDITQPDGKVTPGVYSLLAKASCAQLNGKSTCVTTDDLRKAVSTADLKALGVPDWAVTPAAKAAKDKQLEGLIAPGVYDVRPGATSPQIIGELVKDSADSISAAGLTDQSTGPGMTPYQTLIIASIIEREAVKSDFGKISRVIYNRLAKNMRLEMDSTVNYVLDRPTLLTKPEDRTKAGAYNTYQNTGLPPTPISVPSSDAIQAALKPTDGDWLFFVKCEKDGQSCFATTLEEHNQNVHDAQARGVF